MPLLSASVESAWRQYCSKLDDKPPSKVTAEYHAKLFRTVLYGLGRMALPISRKAPKSPTYVQLRKASMIKLCFYFKGYGLYNFVHYLMVNTFNFSVQFLQLTISQEAVPPKSNDIGPRQALLRDLKFEHLDWKEMSPAHAHHGRSRESLSSGQSAWVLQRVSISAVPKI